MEEIAYGKSLDSRISQHTNPLINQKIMTQTEKSLLFYAEHPDLINNRISKLKDEWDVDRVLDASTSVIGLFGLFMSLIVRRRWFILLPIIALACLIQHALRGGCPLVSLFRNMGVRTIEEIQLELYGLRILMGDFNAIPEITKMDLKDRVERSIDVLSK